MSNYTKLNLSTDDILTQEHLSHIESGIFTAHQEIDTKAEGDHNHDEDYGSKLKEHTHDNSEALGKINNTKISEWDDKSDFSGNYEDLENKPSIPSKTSEMEKDDVYTKTQTDSAIETATTNLATKEELKNKAELLHSHEEYATQDDVLEAVSQVEVDLSGYYTKEEIDEIVKNLGSIGTVFAGAVNLGAVVSKLLTIQESDWTEVEGGYTYNYEHNLDIDTAIVEGAIIESGEAVEVSHKIIDNNTLEIFSIGNKACRIIVVGVDKDGANKFVTREEFEEHLNNHPSGGGATGESKVFTGETIEAERTVEGTVKGLEIFGATEIVDGVENSVGELVEIEHTYETLLTSDGREYKYYVIFYSGENLFETYSLDRFYTQGTEIRCEGKHHFYMNGVFHSTYPSSTRLTDNINNCREGRDNCGIFFDLASTKYEIVIQSSDESGLTTDEIKLLLDEPLRSLEDGSVRDRIFEDEEGVKVERKVRVEVEEVAESWDVGASMPTARTFTSLPVVDGKFYCAGGYRDASKTYVDALEIYDIETNSWASGTNMPTVSIDHSMCAYEGRVYRIGGFNTGGRTNKLEIYDIATNTWTTGANMPTSRDELSSIGSDGKIYCIGGSSSSKLNKLEIYDIATNTWTTGANMPTARSFLTAQLYEGKIYCIGGGATATVTDKLEIYDIATNTWTTGANMPTARRGLSSYIENGKIYCVCGTNGSSYLGAVEVYDIETNTWTVKESISVGKDRIGVAFHRGKVYYVGGYDGSKSTVDVSICALGHKEVVLTQLPTPTIQPHHNPTTLQLKSHPDYTKITTTQDSRKPILKATLNVNNSLTKDDVYMKEEMDSKLEGKAELKHSHDEYVTEEKVVEIVEGMDLGGEFEGADLGEFTSSGLSPLPPNLTVELDKEELKLHPYWALGVYGDSSMKFLIFSSSPLNLLANNYEVTSHGGWSFSLILIEESSGNVMSNRVITKANVTKVNLTNYNYGNMFYEENKYVSSNYNIRHEGEITFYGLPPQETLTLKLKRTRDAESYKGEAGEVIYNLEEDTLVLQDGKTPGGISLAKKSEVTSLQGQIDTILTQLDGVEALLDETIVNSQ